ncbi:MAG: D-glycero-beta-D-manno-heptose 1-phosphate adenylyltransferase [Proteobacteria bacterium]|nr:D-glycero-beta-D-manno-heptose 1-phosphate adenylyltransferase [Pseudomonadota bacterium]MBU1741429.1 D-glycero-beta-D-manno-heptose 1-phosphate adenylyltransferase [Pseudomonadota bacterium]
MTDNPEATPRARRLGRRQVTPDKKFIRDWTRAAEVGRIYRRKGRRLVFTNGCFDLVHAGHVDYLEKARRLGDGLMVGVNTDASVRRLKGPRRPVTPLDQRAFVLGGLGCVDYVVPFDQDTPARLIKAVGPMVLCKGGDWPVDRIVGRETVVALGGEVYSLELVPGLSTRGLIERIIELHKTGDGTD